jgi:mono/diheme cytochrome c family protein
MEAAPSRTKHSTRLTLAVLAMLAMLGLGACAVVWHPALDPQTAVAPMHFDDTTVARGARLAVLGNCAGCHTADPARPLAGGLAILTPFGTIHSTNITPDPATGLGRWSEAAFTRALRDGVALDGSQLYPAFPYDHYAHLMPDDVHALYAWVMTRAPLDAPAQPNHLRFPFGFRPLVAFWNLLYLKRTVWRPDPGHDAEWNRGAYIAQTLAHCDACHTPRTRLGGPDSRHYLGGGEAEGWYAPALNAASPSPLPWTRAQLVAYLRNGIAPDHAAAGGPMQEVVVSLSQADPADIESLATYIHTGLAQAPAQAPRARTDGPLPAPAPNAPSALRTGHEVYATACARCHEAGRGASSGAALPLQKAVALYDPDPRSLLHLVRDGIQPPGHAPGRWMPGFSAILTDDQTIALAAYLRQVGAAQPAWTDLEANLRKVKQP